MIEPWPTHTLVFDLDDTLYPERDFVRSGFRAVDDWLRTARGIDGFLTAANTLFSAGRRQRVFDEALVFLNQTADAVLVSEMLAVYRGHQPDIMLPAESQSVLEWAERRFNLAVVTDGYASVQRLKLAALGLDLRVSCCVITDELGRDRWKPHPAGFERVMAHFPGPSQGYVYVGDNPRKDFIAPRHLGWGTIRFRRQGGEHVGAESAPAGEAAYTIDELSQLTQLLAPYPQA